LNKAIGDGPVPAGKPARRNSMGKLEGMIALITGGFSLNGSLLSKEEDL